MTPQQLELIVRESIEWALAGKTVEDDAVELKAVLVDVDKAARRLAAHANTARAHPIIWVIGIDENNKRLTGSPTDTEISNWLSAVEAKFEGPPPNLDRQLIVVIEPDQVPVVALLFETDQAPYLVGVANPEAVDYEIPWRSGTRTRTARRSEVLRLLVPSVRVPEVELPELTIDISDTPEQTELELQGRLLFLPRSQELVFLPTHEAQVDLVFHSGLAPVVDWSASADDVNWGDWIASNPLLTSFSRERKHETTFCWAQSDGVYIAGPGSVPLSYAAPDFGIDVRLEAITSVEVRMRLPVATTDHVVTITTMLPRVTVDDADLRGDGTHWRFSTS